MKAIGRTIVFVGATLAFGGATLPANAWVYTYTNVATFQSFLGTGGEYAGLKDVGPDAVPVRAQYGRTDDNSYNIYNSRGYNQWTYGPTAGSRINSTIVCNDYPYGDDCSGKVYG